MIRRGEGKRETSLENGDTPPCNVLVACTATFSVIGWAYYLSVKEEG